MATGLDNSIVSFDKNADVKRRRENDGACVSAQASAGGGARIPVTSSVADLSVCGLRWHLSELAVSHTFCLPQREPIPEAPRSPSTRFHSPATCGPVAGWLPLCGLECQTRNLLCQHLA